MTNVDWRTVGEVVGAAGVILTLIYLAFQVRQNTRQMRSEGHQAITDSYSETLGQLLADPALFETVIRGCQDWDSITPFQQSQCHIFYHQHLMHFRVAFQLREKGSIDDDVYRSIEDVQIKFMANPGNRVWWKMVGEGLVEPKLARLINEKLVDADGTEAAPWISADNRLVDVTPDDLRGALQHGEDEVARMRAEAENAAQAERDREHLPGACGHGAPTGGEGAVG